jgi:hypothetical protein
MMMGRRRLPQIPESDKPLSDMTPDELGAYRRQLRRALTDDKVRRGVQPPKTMREAEIWHQAQAERDERRTRRIARAERADSVIAEPDVGQPE